jgi:putative heme-binding domain-containing protein
MRFALIPVIAAVLYGQDSGIKNPHTTPADVTAGAKIFRAHCAECHGLKGEGGRGPNLATGVFFHGNRDADLLKNISDGIPGTAMPSTFFSADQVWQVIAYVRGLGQSGRADQPLGAVASGETLFRDKGCVGCHLARGEGGFRGPDLSLIGSQRSVEHLRQAILDPNAKVLRESWVAKITMENGGAYSGFLLNEDTHTVQILDFSMGLKSLSKHDFIKFDIDKTSAMPSFNGRLSDSELNDLVAYLWSLKRQGSPE